MSDDDYSYVNDSYDDHSYDFDDNDDWSSYSNEVYDYGDDVEQYHDHDDQEVSSHLEYHSEADDATAYFVQSFGGFVYHSRTSDSWEPDDSDEFYMDTYQVKSSN